MLVIHNNSDGSAEYQTEAMVGSLDVLLAQARVRCKFGKESKRFLDFIW